MKKMIFFMILVGLIDLVLGAQLLWTHHEIPKINVDHYKNSNKIESFSSKQINYVPETKLNAHNLGSTADYNIVAPYIIGIINDNYFGYGWQMTPDGAYDNNFKILWDMIYPNAAGDYNNPGKPVTYQELTESLDNYEVNNGAIAIDALLNESFINDKGLLPPTPGDKFDDFAQYLKPTSSFFINMELNKNNLQNDATSLHTITNNNYYGYSLSDTANPIYWVLFNPGTSTNQTVESETDIANNLKTQGARAKTLIASSLRIPGTPTTSLNDLVDNSWLKNNLNTQNTNIVIPAHSLYELVANYYIGYSLENTSDPLFLILFPTNTTPGTPANDEPTILSGLKAKKAAAFTDLQKIFNNPQTPITNVDDLKSGSWLQTELNEQTNKFNNDINTIYNIMEQNYFGYAWGVQNYWLNLLFIPGTNKDLPNSSLVDANRFRMNVLNLYKPPNKTNIYQQISLVLNNPGVQTTNPTLDDLSDAWSLKTNLQNQANNLLIDATSLFNIVSTNYFGYSFNDPSSNNKSLFFMTTGNDNVLKDADSIATSIKNSNQGNLASVYNFIKGFLNTPGTASTSLAGLVDDTWIKNELNIQNTKINNDVAFLYNILFNTFFGYSVDDSTNLLYPALFSSGSNKITLQTKASITNNLKAMRAKAYTNLNQNLDGAGTTNVTLKSNSWLANEISSQTTSLSVDATSLFNLVVENYFGYNLIDTNDGLFAVLFSGTGNSTTTKTQQAVIDELTSLKGNVYALISETIKAPGTFVTNVSQLNDGSWLKSELNNQKTSLVSSLTISINEFYDVFKASFLGILFNANSFDGANYVLLFFCDDKNNNLSLGTSPSEVANTFANNLITKLKENPNFQFPAKTNKKIGALQANSINAWINTLFTHNNGKITLTGDLGKFAAFQKNHIIKPNATSTKSNLGLILGITIPLSLITLGIGSYFMRKKVIQPKINKNIKK